MPNQFLHISIVSK